MPKRKTEDQYGNKKLRKMSQRRKEGRKWKETKDQKNFKKKQTDGEA